MELIKHFNERISRRATLHSDFCVGHINCSNGDGVIAIRDGLTDDKGIQDEDIITLISISIIFTGLIVWFRRLVLQTSVTEQGIKIHYRGLFTKKNFPKADILKAELVTYDPLWNYGGWGLRYSSKRG